MTDPEFQNWTKVQGDKTLALDWPGVNESSLVWEIGGYEGRWALQMAEKYECRVDVFEPQPWAAELARRALENTKADVWQFGLWTHNGDITMNDFGRDGASFIKYKQPDRQTVLIKDVYAHFLEWKIEQIDVCLMNIEGGEFILIPYMLGMGLFSKIKYFWCQWHIDYVQNAHEKWDFLKQKMGETHDFYWDAGVTAQAWVRRDE